MKLIPGETLRKKIAKGDLAFRAQDAGSSRDEFREKLSRIAHLVIRVADAVEHAHEHGILHRDLKPGNIIVDDAPGQPHAALDFSLAKIVQDGKDVAGATTDPNSTPGTPNYMCSPEQAEGGRLTAVSDIHSLGAILYEMLCGVPPFAAAIPLETVRKVIEDQPIRPRSLNSRIDKDLDTICMRCLEKTPVARYPSARALAEDLERWLRHEPIHARPAGVPLRLTRWVARNRLGTALIASLVIGLTVTLVFLNQTLDRQRKLDLRHANSLQLVSAGIDEMWRDPEKRSVKIASATCLQISRTCRRG